MTTYTPLQVGAYTTTDVARRWTQRAHSLGFYHKYYPGSVRKAMQQRRIMTQGKIGSNNLFNAEVADETPIYPWLKPQEGVADCPHCGTQVPLSDVLWRTWVWCTDCRERDADAWEAHAKAQPYTDAWRTYHKDRRLRERALRERAETEHAG